ncbi:MAG: hypothetical protein IJ991_12765 [Thermoguttaceae bacterium]|nr:hypothetical protein [Thermoguttaceae bacterium]
MYDNIFVAAAALAGAAAVGAVAWRAYKKWKNGVRDEVRAWLQTRPNVRLRSVSLRVFDALDEAATRGESFVRCALIGKTEQGGECQIGDIKRLTAEEMRNVGVLTDSGVVKEKEILSDNEVLTLMTA